MERDSPFKRKTWARLGFLRLTSTVLFRGLVVLVPIGLTLYAMFWLAAAAEAWLGGGIEQLTPEYYVPGMGVAAALVLLFIIGALTYSLLFRRAVSWTGHLLERVPLVKTLYGGLCDLMDFLRRSGDRHRNLSQVVMVDLGTSQLLGFVTREDFSKLPHKMAYEEDTVAVYLPMSYQIGGFTVFVSRKRVTAIDMTVEDAMRFSLTAGMSAHRNGAEDEEASDGLLAQLDGTEKQ